MNDHLCVASGLEDVPGCGERLRQFLEVEDLTVVDDGHRPVLVEQGLVTAFQIDDRQPPMSETDARLDMNAGRIRSAMRQRCGHAH